MYLFVCTRSSAKTLSNLIQHKILSNIKRHLNNNHKTNIEKMLILFQKTLNFYEM